jgi:hypothetical protein
MLLIFPKNEVRFFLIELELNLLDVGELSVVGEFEPYSSVSLIELMVEAFLRNVEGIVGVAVGWANFRFSVTAAAFPA